jgi:hypothetical protein
LERSAVEITFAAAPEVMRRVINQIASVNDQLFIIRTLYVRNEVREGPPRDQPAQHASETDESASAKPGGLRFIVGNEHIETAAKIEMVRFTY